MLNELNTSCAHALERGMKPHNAWWKLKGLRWLKGGVKGQNGHKLLLVFISKMLLLLLVALYALQALRECFKKGVEVGHYYERRMNSSSLMLTVGKTLERTC